MPVDGNILRQSQVVTTFGPGSLVDLPKQSIIIGGLDDWKISGRRRIREPRLEATLLVLLSVPALELYEPPAYDEDAAQNGNPPPRFVAARVFPHWYVTQEPAAGGGGTFRRRRLVGEAALTRGEYRDPEDGKRKPVVPVRFVAACPRRHVEDVDWRIYIHHGATTCTRTLWLEERGTSGDVADVVVGCDCGLERKLLDAVSPGTRALGICDGQRPWLGPYARERCTQNRRLLIRTASNAYFPELISAISLPDEDDVMKAAVDRWWTDLQKVPDAAMLALARQFNSQMAADLAGYSDNDLMSAISRKRDGQPSLVEDALKPAEFDFMASGKPVMGRDTPDSPFFAETVEEFRWRAAGEALLDPIESVVVIRRLREVIAQTGFTRFDALRLMKTVNLISEWREQPLHEQQLGCLPLNTAAKAYSVTFEPPQLETGLDEIPPGRANELCATVLPYGNTITPAAVASFPGWPTSCSTHIALESGYTASSFRERIYASDGRYGILIYTATSGAEGTLGGLVATVKDIARHLRRAIETADLCSNDPVCAEHKPDDRLTARFLHGAACHSCQLIAETSCEQRNDFLDRSLVIETVRGDGWAFFSGGQSGTS